MEPGFRLRPSLFSRCFVIGVAFAFVVLPLAAIAETPLALTEVDHDGAVIAPAMTLYRSDFSTNDSFWTFRFAWPNQVNFTRGFIGVVRGSFGSMDAAPQFGINYWSGFTGWGAGAGQVQTLNLAAPPLGGGDAPSGTYTAIVAETPGIFDSTGTMNWFASGGTLGTAPTRYALLTFSYIAEDRSEEIPNALHEVIHSGRALHSGDEAYREEFSSPEDNFWNFNFDWPEAVDSQRSLFFIFHGTFGDLANGTPVQGSNYSLNTQPWSSGSNHIGKQFSFPHLLSPDTAAGPYTLLVAEIHPKHIGSADPGIPQWFASGGSSGIAPKRFASFTFDFKGNSIQYAECCSSVLFLPGIKGSILKNGTETLWPADMSGTDIAELAFDENGHSVEHVFVDGILPSFKIHIPLLGDVGPEIYSGFMSFMDSLVANTEDDIDIRAWKPFPYDWRYAPDYVVSHDVETPDGPVNLIQDVETLAAGSATGKVTIIAHSMGGLVAKALIRALDEQGKSNLIDAFVMVGSPQLGTPQAIASLLHGDREGIPGKSVVPNLVSTAFAVRSTGHNFPSAHALLPAERYFNVVSDPVLHFDDVLFTRDWRGYWGDTINSYIPFVEFLTGVGVFRERPNPTHVHVPEVLRSDLVDGSRDFHATYDQYVLPSGIRVVELAGWGEETTKAVEYKTWHFTQSYDTTPTVEGDGVVVYSSAVSSPSAEKYFFNLDLDDNGLDHGTLLNSSRVQALFAAVIRKSNIDGDSYISITKPNTTDIESKLRVSSHSPVILGVQDSHGNFTGIYPNQDLTGAYLYVKENIPGSSFIVSGDSQNIFVPKEGTYTVTYKGTGIGPTTLEIGEFSNDIVTPVAAYTDVPTNPDSSATLLLDGRVPEGAHLALDQNSDGKVDTYTAPDNGALSVPELLVNITTAVTGLTATDKLKAKLLKRVERIEKKITKQKFGNASKIALSLERQIAKKAGKGKLDEAEAQEILNLLDQLESAL